MNARLPYTGLLAASLIGALIFGTLLAVALTAGGLGGLGEWDLRAIRFTVLQAAASATLSSLFAIFVAKALFRRRFAGRGFLILLLGAPFILPVIVAIMGLIGTFGRNGWANAVLGGLGLPEFTIYGWHGVIIAHVFFNLPLATRLLLQSWAAIPAERFRLAESLGFTPRDLSRHLERPMLREALPGIWLAVFLVCLASFAVALTLGGGPRATTVELAIYQAFRFDIDMGKAASLALVQVLISIIALVLARKSARFAGFGGGLDRDTPSAAMQTGGLRKAGDILVITAATAFLLLPLSYVVLSGLPHLGGLDASSRAAAIRSVVMAVTSAGLMLMLGVPLALAAARGGRLSFVIEAAGMLPLVASSLVLGTGIYLIFRGIASPEALALPVTITVNAVIALPFGLRALLPAARIVEADYGRLAASLDLHGFSRLRLLTLPRMGRALGFAGGLAAALAMGDLGVIALFGSEHTATLPLRLYQLMGSYRMGDASAAAVLLMALSFALFWVFDRLGRKWAGE